MTALEREKDAGREQATERGVGGFCPARKLKPSQAN